MSAYSQESYYVHVEYVIVTCTRYVVVRIRDNHTRIRLFIRVF